MKGKTVLRVTLGIDLVALALVFVYLVVYERDPSWWTVAWAVLLGVWFVLIYQDIKKILEARRTRKLWYVALKETPIPKISETTFSYYGPFQEKHRAGRYEDCPTCVAKGRTLPKKVETVELPEDE
jgi:hypothetical protein